jgi:hypothetical protein
MSMKSGGKVMSWRNKLLIVAAFGSIISVCQRSDALQSPDLALPPATTNNEGDPLSDFQRKSLNNFVDQWGRPGGEGCHIVSC